MITSSHAEAFTIDVKDATMYDTCEMLFIQAGNPPHQIDESAKDIKVTYQNDFPNTTWDSVLRIVSNKFGYKVVREFDRSYSIVKR